MRLGLLGLGRIGAFHAETLTSLPVVESLVVSDPVAELAAETGEKLGAQVASTPEALLASGVDGVVIAASTDVHPELILLCVNAGIPAFCEKPVARDSAVAAGLARQVADSGRTGRVLPRRSTVRLLHGPVRRRVPGRAHGLYRSCRRPPHLAVHGRGRPRSHLDRRCMHALATRASPSPGRRSPAPMTFPAGCLRRRGAAHPDTQRARTLTQPPPGPGRPA